MAFGDLLDRAVLTETIRRQDGLEEMAGSTLAPQVNVNEMFVRMRIAEVRPGGLAQFKAPGAGTPVYRPQYRLREEMIGLVIMEEMTPFNERERLDSPAEDVALLTANSLIDIGVDLTNRERRLTEKMRWDGLLSGRLDIKYQDGFASVDYGYRPGIEFVQLAGNRRWTDPVNALPMDDFIDWHTQMSTKSGFPITQVWMNSITLRYLAQIQQIQTQLGTWNRLYVTPTIQDIQTLLQLSAPITVYDSFYFTDYLSPTRVQYKYLPDGYVVLVGQTSVNGINTAEMMNGPMVVTDDGWNSLTRVQGPTDEMFADKLSKTEYIRHGASRMLRINFPENLMIVKVA